MIKLIELNDIRLAQMLADYLQLQGIPCQLQARKLVRLFSDGWAKLGTG